MKQREKQESILKNSRKKLEAAPTFNKSLGYTNLRFNVLDALLAVEVERTTRSIYLALSDP
jgi:hypothetical protein